MVTFITPGRPPEAVVASMCCSMIRAVGSCNAESEPVTGSDSGAVDGVISTEVGVNSGMHPACTKRNPISKRMENTILRISSAPFFTLYLLIHRRDKRRSTSWNCRICPFDSSTETRSGAVLLNRFRDPDGSVQIHLGFKTVGDFAVGPNQGLTFVNQPGKSRFTAAYDKQIVAIHPYRRVVIHQGFLNRGGGDFFEYGLFGL